ncbi:MAG: CofH family radical SAM protein [Bacteroidales bacterium]|nr:CofH family radical SAM protein [Bacteroidales bacterium]
MSTRKTRKELLELYEAPLPQLREEADAVRRSLHGDSIFYNRNFHIEPSNICTHRCRFCSYRRDDASQPGAWSMETGEIVPYCESKFETGMTEIHIVGSVQPGRPFSYYEQIVALAHGFALRRGTAQRPVTVKAYTAVEIDDMCRFNSLDAAEVLGRLKDAGLETMPGGGAEIFSPHIRQRICPDKCTAERWLDIHRTAHRMGIPTNCTMLFGHIESRADRIDHLLALRSLQDETGGFNAFIPLKFRAANNSLSGLGEVSSEEVLRTFAIARLALDGIPHIKAYWPMLGKELALEAMGWGADDLDGTINDSTRIYSLAGAQDRRPTLTVSELQALAATAGYKAVERDSYYNIIS